MIARLVFVLALAASCFAPSLAETATLSAGWEHVLAGRNADAEAAFVARLAEDPADLSSAIGLAALVEARADADAALAILGAALQAAEGSPLEPGALSRLASLLYRATDGGAGAMPLLESIARAERAVSDAELRAVVGLAYADTLSRFGELDAAKHYAGDVAGRLRTWTLLGPFGRFAPLALARPFAPEEGELDPTRLPAGPTRVEPFRIDTEFPQGRVVVPLQYQGVGVVYALSDVLVEETTRVRARVSANTSFAIFVDGREVLRVDRGLEHPPLATSLALELPAGRHRLMAKLANEGRFVAFELLLEDADEGLTPGGLRNVPVEGGFVTGSSARVLENPTDRDAIRVSREDPAALIAATWWLRGRDLDRESGQLLGDALERWPDSSLLRSMMGEHLKNAATGASATEDLSRARGMLEQALAADSSLHRARQYIAEMDEAASRLDEAWAAAGRVLESRPGDADMLLLRARIAMREGWMQEARLLLDEAASMSPWRTDVLEARIGLARNVNALDELGALLERKGRLAPGSEDWAQYLSASGRVEEALAAWQRMINERPSYLFGWLGKVEVLTDAGRFDEALATLEKIEAVFPHEAWIPFRRAGVLALFGDESGAKRELERALALDPSRIGLRATIEAREGKRIADPWLVDVDEVLADVEEPPAGVDSALLADTAVVIIDRFGGQSEVYQGIHAVYTRAGVEQEGELQLQPGVQMEGIRIHKADGRRVDVALPPRPPISLPGLEPGDVFEYVWRRYIPPMNIIPGALDNRSLFLFQGPERDYDFSRYVIIHDAALELEICGREEGLETSDEREGDLRIRSWTGRRKPRLALEPSLPSQLEVVPHVRLGLGIAWRDVGDLVRAAMDGSLHADEPLPTLARSVRQEAQDETPLALAKALHAVVGREIGVGASSLRLGTPASVAASLGEGNRSLIALVLARELGLEASLVLARPIELAGRELECPTPGLFSYALVEIEAGTETVYLDFNDLNHPFDSMNARFSGADALRVPMDVGRDPEIIQLPKREPELLEHVDAKVTLSAEGLVAGRLTLTTGGTLAAALRKAFREMPIDNQANAYRSLASRIFPGAQVVDSSIGGLDEPADPVVIDLVFEKGLLGRRTPTGVALPVVAGPLPLASQYASRPDRRYPLLLDMSEKRIDRLQVELPEGLELAFEPQDLELSGEFGDYSLQSSVKDRRLVIERRASIPPRRVETDEYAAFRAFARAIEEVETQEILLRVLSPSLR